MPQLDTSTWFTIMVSSSLTLFIIMQLKIHSQHFPLNPMSKKMLLESTKSPWEKKWTKIYFLPLLPQQ